MDLQSEKLEMFNKEKYKEQPNKDKEYNKWNEKYTRENQYRINEAEEKNQWGGRQNGGYLCHGTE